MNRKARLWQTFSLESMKNLLHRSCAASAVVIFFFFFGGGACGVACGAGIFAVELLAGMPPQGAMKKNFCGPVGQLWAIVGQFGGTRAALGQHGQH